MIVDGAFGLENLRVIERADEAPGPGQIAVRLRAASVNYRDYLMVRGQYNPRQPLPLVPLSDAVGVIEALGEGVRSLKVGDRVCPLFCQGYFAGEPTKDKLATTLGGPLDGVLRERMVLSAESVVAVPAGLDDREAATLPCAALTAWNAVIEEGRVQPGQTVLIQGSGGVSLFALAFAKSVGARVIATSKSEAKREKLAALGADHVIDYVARPDWGKAAVALTGGRGVDLVIEVGGAGTLAESLRAVRPGGTVAIIGVLGGAATEVQLTSVLMRHVRLQGVFVGHKEMFVRMARAYEGGLTRPVIDRVFAFTEARAALEHLASGAHFGKVVIDLA
jgi:NADPH:quinone reductase-like Zn-dependent oxidoreductase